MFGRSQPSSLVSIAGTKSQSSAGMCIVPIGNARAVKRCRWISRMIGCEDIIGHAHHRGYVQRTKEDGGSTDHGHQMLAAELETPRRMTPQLLLLILDPNDTPAVDAITAGTFCAVSFPTTTHDGNKDGQTWPRIRTMWGRIAGRPARSNAGCSCRKYAPLSICRV